MEMTPQLSQELNSIDEWELNKQFGFCVYNTQWMFTKGAVDFCSAFFS